MSGSLFHPASELRPARHLFIIRRGVSTVDSSVDLNMNLTETMACDVAVAISRLLAQARVVSGFNDMVLAWMCRMNLHREESQDNNEYDSKIGKCVAR